MDAMRADPINRIINEFAERETRERERERQLKKRLQEIREAFLRVLADIAQSRQAQIVILTIERK